MMTTEFLLPKCKIVLLAIDYKEFIDTIYMRSVSTMQNNNTLKISNEAGQLMGTARPFKAKATHIASAMGRVSVFNSADGTATEVSLDWRLVLIHPICCQVWLSVDLFKDQVSLLLLHPLHTAFLVHEISVCSLEIVNIHLF